MSARNSPSVVLKRLSQSNGGEEPSKKKPHIDEHLLRTLIVNKVKKEPLIWNILLPDYTKQELKVDIWVKMAEELSEELENSIDARSLQSQWRNIRDAYVKRRKELRAVYGPSKDLTANEKVSWYFWDKCGFLHNVYNIIDRTGIELRNFRNTRMQSMQKAMQQHGYDPEDTTQLEAFANDVGSGRVLAGSVPGNTGDTGYSRETSNDNISDDHMESTQDVLLQMVKEPGQKGEKEPSSGSGADGDVSPNNDDNMDTRDNDVKPEVGKDETEKPADTEPDTVDTDVNSPKPSAAKSSRKKAKGRRGRRPLYPTREAPANIRDALFGMTNGSSEDGFGTGHGGLFNLDANTPSSENRRSGESLFKLNPAPSSASHAGGEKLFKLETASETGCQDDQNPLFIGGSLAAEEPRLPGVLQLLMEKHVEWSRDHPRLTKEFELSLLKMVTEFSIKVHEQEDAKK